MYATVQASEFHAALKSVKKVIPSNGNLPILAHVHLDARDGALSLTGTNLEIALRTRIAADCSALGAWTVPAAQLLEWLAVYPDNADVSITRKIAEPAEIAPFDIDTHGMDDWQVSALKAEHKAKCDARAERIARNNVAVQFTHNTYAADGSAIRSRMTLRGVDAEDYPVMRDTDGASLLGTVAARDLLTLIKDTFGYAATNDSRPILAGMHLTPYGYDGTRRGWLHAYATDGVRASSASVDMTDGTAEPITVPARAMKQAMPLIAELDGADTISIYVTDGKYPHAIFDCGGSQVIVRTIDGAYPLAGIRNELSASIITMVDVKRLDLDKLLKRALAIESAEGTDKKAVTVIFGSARDILTASSGAGTDSIEYVSMHGADVPSQTYYVKQVADAARSLSDKTITLTFTDGSLRITSVNAAGDRCIMRVTTEIERKRRAYRTIGAVCSYTRVTDGMKTALTYTNYGMPSAEKYADDIRYKTERYATECAELDAIMADAWEGYAEPTIYDCEPTDAERTLLGTAREYHRVASIDAPSLDAVQTATDGPTAIVAPNVYPRVDDYRDGSAMLDVHGYHAAIAAWVKRENDDVAARYARLDDTPSAEPSRAPLLLAARSVVKKSILPPGLPIAENCDSATALRLWREYQDIVNTATRVYERENSRRYHYGSGIVILHELPFVWGDGGLAEPILCVTTHHTNGADAVMRGMKTTYYDDLGSAYRALISSVPARAECPPGRAITDDMSGYHYARLWYRLASAVNAVQSATAPNSPIVDASAEPIAERPRKERKRRTTSRVLNQVVVAEPRGSGDTCMFDASDLPSLDAPSLDDTLPATMFTVPSAAQWRDVAASIAALAAIPEPAEPAERPGSATGKRSFSIVRTVDGAYTVA